MKEYTLPVWVVAAAKSATHLLLGGSFRSEEMVYLPNSEKSYQVPISSSALLEKGAKALAISHCESGLSLDITRGLEIWTYVQIQDLSLLKKGEDHFPEWLEFVGGQGLGKFEQTNKTCISQFSRELIIHNLYHLVPDGLSLRLEVVLPYGLQVAERTSNQAFGIIDGLALIGTQAEGQDSASPEQISHCLTNLTKICKSDDFDGSLIYVIGENGLDLVKKLSFSSKKVLKTGNWLGPLIVAAAQEGVKNLLVFGYHGKLIKLAGGVFHTHNHLADARLEILTSIAVHEKLPLHLIQLINKASSVQEALTTLEKEDVALVQKLWNKVAEEVERRSMEYVNRYFSSSMQIGALLFDRQRQIRWAGTNAHKQLDSWEINVIG